MWLPSCCHSDDSSSKMRNTVKIYHKKLITTNQSGTQKNKYSGELILIKRCYIKDRSLTTQDTAVTNGIKNANDVKEFIFKYFDITSIEFNEIVWSGVRFKVLNSNKMSNVTLDGKKYIASDSRPFISILAGVKEL
jgi:hypothetical protein